MASILLPFFLWSLAVSASLSTCVTVPQCTILVSAALAAQFGVVNTTVANELVAANIVDSSPIYSSLNQCFDVICAIPLQSQLIGLDFSYRSINETMASLGVQLSFMAQIWTNCTAAAKINQTLNCDLQNRLMGRVNEKMKWVLKKHLSFLEDLFGQCLGNIVCETYVGQQINSTSAQISGQLIFDTNSVGFASRILNCSEWDDSCQSVLESALVSNFTQAVRLLSIPGLVNATSAYAAYSVVLLMAPFVTDMLAAAALLSNLSQPVLSEFLACSGVKSCVGTALFVKMEAVILTFWKQCSNFLDYLPFFSVRWCVSSLCISELEIFHIKAAVAATALREAFFQFIANSPSSYSIPLAATGLVVSFIVCLCGVGLLVLLSTWKVFGQQIYVILIVTVVGQTIHGVLVYNISSIFGANPYYLLSNYNSSQRA
jgi:hypothetical protein